MFKKVVKTAKKTKALKISALFINQLLYPTHKCMINTANLVYIL